MQALVDTLIAHGYLVVFFWVFAGQIGIPLPAVPVLLAAGALAGAAHLDLATIALLSVLASLLGDAGWFLLGRRRGRPVLGFLCRLSLEPDACVGNTQTMFARNQALTVVLGKFVPGISTMAPPLAGMFGMSWPRFLVLDGVGAVVWTLTYLLPGYALSDRLEQLAEHAALTGTWLLALFTAGIAAFLLIKFARRRALLRDLRIARIEPAELHGQLANVPPPFLVDLRQTLDFEADPRVIPGAIHFAVEDVERHHAAIPRDRDVVLYCT